MIVWEAALGELISHLIVIQFCSTQAWHQQKSMGASLIYYFTDFFMFIYCLMAGTVET